MGKLKNSLLKQLETDPQFADHYWQIEDQQPVPELPNGCDRAISQSDLTLIMPILWNSGNNNEIPPF